MGCCWVISRACRSPVTTVPSAAMSVTTSASRIEGRMTSVWRLLPRCHALIASTKTPAVRKQAVIVCRKAPTAVELVSTAPKSLSSARPVASLTMEPTGCCIHEFAARMK